MARKYGTDKTYYTPFYSMLLESRRLTTNRVLEIGIGSPEAMKHVPGYKPGASLRMWEEYFPDAQIYGIDIDRSVLFETRRITTFVADQTKPEQYEELVEFLAPFDLIVDDGSHKVKDQVDTFDLLYHTLAPGGLYIIEDVNGDVVSESLVIPHLRVGVCSSDLTGHCVVINA